MKILAILRALILAITMALFLILYAFSRVVLKHSASSTFRLRRRWLGWIAWPVFGIKVEVEGKPIGEPAIYVCNHRSFSDPVVVCRYLDAFVIAKAEIAKYPVINKGAEVTGVIYVDRSDRDSRYATREKMVETVREGYNVLVYPEGTVGGQETILPYKRGPFNTAAANGFPVVPVVIEYRDTKDLWVKISLPAQFFRQFSSWTTEVKLKFGEPIIMDDGNALHEQVEAYTKRTMRAMHKDWSRAIFTGE